RHHVNRRRLDVTDPSVLQLDLQVGLGGTDDLDILVGAERADLLGLAACLGVNRSADAFNLEPRAGGFNGGFDSYLGRLGMAAPMVPASPLFVMDRGGRG